jgi:hypothetical protein
MLELDGFTLDEIKTVSYTLDASSDAHEDISELEPQGYDPPSMHCANWQR